MNRENTAQPPTAKRLVLSLLSAPDMHEVSIALLVNWGELFGIDPATLRVTVGRLTRQGLLASTRRGVYHIGPRGQLIAEKARSWVAVEQRVAPWRGQWILVHAGHLGRTNRTALRMRERAFRLNGFVEYVAGLWLRPANLAEPLTGTRTSLLALGLEPAAVMSLASELPGVEDQELFALWPRVDIEAAYRLHLEAMQRSTARLPKLELAEAARETIEVGEAVIRQINADPLLPTPMINAAARQTMIEHMLEYDKLGRETWRRYIAEFAG
ncbi:PaaX [Pseudohalioglobus lutimaris]|uniref:PaaX n=1 Tax=Pseudohalioglobus lutimaris TaxID=1737061 RepID=A0A2N5X3A5_9GAMM|nr:PaaX [Pseudohalioglobus lutimaris]PLW68969.1 PaaX [Pseudohalioglobus lutimaris]